MIGFENKAGIPYLQILLLAVVYFITARFGLAMDAVGGFATLIWPPSGIALAALFLFGKRLWPGVFLGAALVNYAVGAPGLTAIGIGIGNTLEAVFGCWLLAKTNFHPGLRRIKDVLALTALTALLATSISAFIGVLTLLASNLIKTTEIGITMLAWWLGDAISVAFIAPLVFVWTAKTRNPRFPKLASWRTLEGVALGLLALFLSFTAFYSLYAALEPGTFPGLIKFRFGPFILFPLLIWAALRFGQRGLLTAVFGMFVAGASSILLTHPSPLDTGTMAFRFAYLQLFIGVAALTGMILTAVLSESKDAAQQAQEYHDRLDEVQRAAKVVSWDWNLRTRSIAWAGAQVEVYGTKLSDHRSWMNRIPPEDRKSMRDLTKAAIKDKTEFNVEFRLMWPSGEIHWLESRGKTVTDEAGRPSHMVGIHLDITEKKRAEEALKENEESYRIIAETASDAIITIDEDCKILFANSAVTKIFGYEYHDLIGRKLHDLIPPENRQEFQAVFSHFVQTGRPPGPASGFELKGFHKDGYEVPIEVSVGEYRAGGRRAFTWIVRDTTEQKRIQSELIAARDAAERMSQYKSTFLANMSHEIRTPLGAILGFSQLLKDPELHPSERAKYIDIINRNGTNLTSLIDDILDLSKIEAGRLEIESVNFSLRALVAEVLSLLDLKAKAKGLYLTAVFEDSAPEQIISDQTRLRQILTNIVGNAVKFTEAGGVIVSVKSDPIEGLPDTKQISFYVRDTGPGIPVEFRDRLFQSFTQTDSSTTRKFGGTGLGLALSKKLARALGGDIVLGDCSPGHGCTFIATIRAATAAERRQVASPVLRPRLQDLSNINVLLVEDSTDNQLLIQRMLNAHGAHVELAGNGQEGIARSLHGDFDIVLMDIQMPILDGYEATRELRRRGFRKPILALSAHAMKEDRDLSLDAGCNDHLVKPIDPEILISSVARSAASPEARSP